ncbi:rRNA N6-adenosine-methyltransferase ZCCHC4 [Terrapene carolina triunguis]|uniref:rRNA N(6)-adenosine-methyltransferase ZCCHC4 n=1 Tax=Terrapene triunguis TaxID=2587831 RepID=A0A674I1I1_9SAUR|nr:rRNA N6-adenosine-methyltransferase ZCCHC4 [Terrapene carolina triunguis]
MAACSGAADWGLEVDMEDAVAGTERNLRGSGVAVLLGQESGRPAPCCPHGPTLLFVKISQGKEEGRRFYACSACRDRKDCNFFQWENEKVSEARLSAREEANRSYQPSLSHRQNVERYKQFGLLPLSKRKFCQECQQLLLPMEWGKHCGHQVLSDLSIAHLQRPSQLLCPLKNKKTNAQYLFADRSCQFLLDLIIALGFKRVLCVGTPRLHELIRLKVSREQESSVKSLLLDIDFRYSQFYTEEDFCHYNMFNHYFFDGEAAHEICRKFLHQEEGEGVILVTDPPFGGLVEPLAFSFKKLIATWRETQEEDHSNKELPIFWIFPYFFESRILEFFPSFSMMDYQVDYDNHALYKHGKTGRKQSPVRIFTNISPSMIVLPVEEGYRFCSVCQRYVSSGNQHCEICNSCTSKDGRRWNHCFLCKKCVKPSWIHCNTCNRCALRGHTCESAKAGCFICGGAGHKRSTCPNLPMTERAGKADRNQKLKKNKKIKMDTVKRPYVKHATFSRKKIKNKKKKNTLAC